jgi:capsular exopolysaccharide synthesis family protein
MYEEIDFRQIIEIYANRKLVLLLGVLAGLIIASLITFRAPSKYEATVELVVSQSIKTTKDINIDDSYQSSLLGERLIKTFSKLAKSRTLADRVIDSTKVSLSPEGIQESIATNADPTTQLIDITVTNGDPVLAQKLANTVADELIKMVEKLSPATSLITLKIVDKAKTPTEPSQPKPVLNLVIGLLGGLIITSVFIMTLELLDLKIREESDAVKTTGLISLGRIMNTKDPRIQSNPDLELQENFRFIRTNLKYLVNPLQVICSTSANKDEGKTTISENLGIVFAQAGHKVLLIDCDLHKSRLSELFEKTNYAGLTNVLLGIARFEKGVYKTLAENLDIMPSGINPTVSSELINSEKMDRLIEKAKKRYDIIILDCPPLLAISDAAIVASKADSVLLTVSINKTKISDMVSALESLRYVNAKVTGFVVNRVKITTRYGYREHYFGNKNDSLVNNKTVNVS